MKLLIFLMSTVLVLPFAFAEEQTLSLENAIDEGLNRSPELKTFVDSKQAAQWNKVNGMSYLLPDVKLSARQDLSNRYETVPVNLGGSTVVIQEVFPRTDYRAEARWTIFDWGANWNKYQASSARFQAANEVLDRKTFELRKQIELAFYHALAAQRFEEVAEENLKTVEGNLAQVMARYDGGRATRDDVLRVEVQKSDALTEVQRTQDNVVITRKKLTQIMGNNEDARLLTGTLPVPESREAIQRITIVDPSQRQDFYAAQLHEEANQHEANAALGELLPSITLGASYDRYLNDDYPGEAYGGFRDAWSMGLTATWTLFDGGKTIAKSGMEKAASEKALHEYQAAILSLPADFEMWKRRYSYSSMRYEVKKQDVERSTESLHISTVSFERGRKTVTDVLAAETDLFRSRADVVQSQLDAAEARINLELTLGKEI